MADPENKEVPAKAAEAPAAPAQAGGRSPKKKKSRPTNCLQSNKRIRRKDWYYRDGKYFANKKNYLLYKKAQETEKAKKAGEAAAAAEKAAPTASTATVEEPPKVG